MIDLGLLCALQSLSTRILDKMPLAVINTEFGPTFESDLE